MIGFGTGVTAGELAELDEVESVTIAEISSAVIKAAPLFDFANHGVSMHPKVQIVHSDAYRALLKGSRHLRRDRLGAEQPLGDRHRAALLARVPRARRATGSRRGGVYCQWFHLYETSAEAIELVLQDLRVGVRPRRGLVGRTAPT